MENSFSMNLKSESLNRKKTIFNLFANLVIAILGVTSLFIKFFLVDGVVAFRAFTVDGNLYTTIVSIVALAYNVKEIITKKEVKNKTLFYYELASAVTEAVIFIVVMIGYLPIFDDNPKITPYHMFCLHVAIPVLAVARFIFLEKPQGLLKPAMLLRGSIPIGIYGIGVIIAIKTGILPMYLVPYSFLNFKANFLWYFLFALIVIPTFGYLWSWMFYRLNIRASVLWYSKEDIEKLNKERIKNLSSFDVVNSTILLLFCAFAILVLMFSLMGSSKTTTKVQHESMVYTAFYILDDCHYRMGPEDWEIRDNTLYKGNIMFGNGTEAKNNKQIIPDELVLYDTSVFVAAGNLSDEVAKGKNPYDFVCVQHSSGKKTPVNQCGETLDTKIVSSILYDRKTDGIYYKVEKVNGVKYYHFCMAFGKNMEEFGVGIISLYIPVSDFTVQAKDAEINNDIMMVLVVFFVFTGMYLITTKWILALEKSVNYLKDIANDNIPEKPISLGKSKRLSGLEKQINSIRDKKLKQ